MTEHRTENPGNGATVRHDADGTARIELLGEVDHSVVNQLDEAMRTALDSEAQRIVVDFRRLSFFDSACISALVRARAQAEENGRALALAHVDQYARRILDLTGLLAVFTLEDSAGDDADGAADGAADDAEGGAGTRPTVQDGAS